MQIDLFIRNTTFFSDISSVLLYCPWREVEQLSNLFGGLTLFHKMGDLNLRRGEMPFHCHG